MVFLDIAAFAAQAVARWTAPMPGPSPPSQRQDDKEPLADLLGCGRGAPVMTASLAGLARASAALATTCDPVASAIRAHPRWLEGGLAS